MQWSDGKERLDVFGSGTIEFTDDLTDVKSMSDGASLSIRQWIGVVPHTIELKSVDGKIVRSYYVAGMKRPWSDEAQRMLTEKLPAVIRRTGWGAESRVRSILGKKGVAGVLDEIDLLGGDYARRVYFTALVDAAHLDAVSVVPVITKAGADIRSDYDRSQVLQRIARDVPLDQRAGAAYVQATGSMKSDYEKRRALTALLASKSTVQNLTPLVVQTTTTMRSDYDRGEVLRAALARGPAGNIDQADAFWAALDATSSAYEKRRVLMELVDRPSLNVEMRRGLLMATTGIRSDYDRSQVLQAYVKAHGVDSDVRQPFFAAVAALSSDYERRQILQALARREALAPDVRRSAFETIGMMRSDYDRAEALLAFVGSGPMDAAARQAFVAAAERIGSSYEQNRVLAALVRSERR